MDDAQRVRRRVGVVRIYVQPSQPHPETSLYRASLRLFELGALVDGAVDLQSLLHPHLAELANATGETIHLAVLQGAEIVYLDKFDSPLPVAAYSRIGGRAPAYCVASGKAMLAALDLDAAALAQQLGQPTDLLLYEAGSPGEDLEDDEGF